MTLFARNGFAQVPTTQTVELVGVPFLRTGSTVDDVQAGVEAALSKRTTMTATYDFQWVDFDEDPAFTTVLRGGRSHGGSVSLRRVLSSRTSAVADYRLQHALVSDVNEVFTVQNASAGLEHRVTELVHVFMMVGVSHLSVNAFGPPRTGPSVQAGLSRQFQAASAALTYGRSFIPSYGFGGTMQNEELTAHLHLPLSRRLSQQSSVAWRRNQPLTAGELPLTSLWIEVAVGYALHPSVRMRGVLRGGAPGDRTRRRRHQPQSDGRPARGQQTAEDALMEETHVHALDYVSVLQRRKWWLVTPIVASVFAGVGLVRYLPKEYRSSTTLGVSAPLVSPNFVNPSSTFDNEERLRAISQQLLSVPILDRVIQEEQLTSDAPRDAQIGQLRWNIGITVPNPVAGAVESRRLDAFVLSYADEDPARAQRIANRLARVFVDENSKSRTERAEDTSAFIGAQLSASQARLAELEARLRKAKESYMGELPEQTQANLHMLSGLRQQLDANATQFRGEQDRLSMIERQISALKQGTADALLLPRGNETAQSPESRVAALQRQLLALQMKYTDKHPDIQRLRDELAAARREAAAALESPPDDRAAQLEADPGLPPAHGRP